MTNPASAHASDFHFAKSVALRKYRRPHGGRVGGGGLLGLFEKR